MNKYPVAAADAITIENPAPQAIFDVELGQHVDFIDFDIDAYKEHLLDRGLSEEQLVGHSVRFSHKAWWDPSEGHCDVPNKQLHINIGRSTTEEHADEIVRHEAEHFVSFTQRPRKFDLSNFGRTAIVLSGLSGGATVASAVATAKNYEAIYEVTQPAAFGYVALAGLSYIIYYYSAEERHARAAARDESHAFVTIERSTSKKGQ